jgi:UPF0042 nucleotide-binding protein
MPTRRRPTTKPGSGSAADPLPDILVITGLSGSGKTHVSRALEDRGWFCVDNLPTRLIPSFAESIGKSEELKRCALVVDMRGQDFVKLFPSFYHGLRAQGLSAQLLFLEADDDVLVRRFSETRRPHPLAFNQPLADGIAEERVALGPIRKLSDVILDTSDYNVHQLREWIRERFGLGGDAAPMVLSVVSFGYKFGVPQEADLVFEVRFLPNPNFVPRLQALTGADRAVVRYLRRQPETLRLLKRLGGFLRYLLPRYEREGKSYLTIAIGCTGGQHRSVMVAEALAKELGAPGRTVRVRHRDTRVR